MIKKKVLFGLVLGLMGLTVACESSGESADSGAPKVAETTEGIPPLDSLPPSKYVPINDRAFSSIDEVIATLYEIISGPAGPRDWDKMRELCLPGADFSSFGKKEDGTKVFRKGTIDSYIQNSGSFFLQSAFFETEIGRRVDRFGHVAQVFSAYQSTFEKGGEVKARGINSIQLVRDQDRWFIANVIWDSESESEKIPIEYLR
jgi:hypothetical protein